MEPRIITPPESEPVTLEEVKEDLRIEHAEDDARLNRLITEAREFIERRAQMSLLTQTREADLPAFPDGAILLWGSRPIQSIVSVSYRAGGADASADAASYYLHQNALYAVSGWPASGEFVTVRFIAGYADAASVPGPLKIAIRVKVEELYDGKDRMALIDALLSNYLLLAA